MGSVENTVVILWTISFSEEQSRAEKNLRKHRVSEWESHSENIGLEISGMLAFHLPTAHSGVPAALDRKPTSGVGKGSKRH